MKKNLLFILAFFVANFLNAQTPANDNCADAQPIAVNDVLDYSTLEATTDGPVHPDAACFGVNDSIPKDIWFVFTPDTDDIVVVSNCGTSGTFDSRMVIYQANADCTVGADDFLACNDDGPGIDCGVASSIGFIPEAGSTYLIRLGGFADDMTEPTSGEGTITITLANGPDNDFCAAAIPVMLGAGQQYTTVDALTDGPDHLDNPCFGFGSTTANSDIWYTFTPDFTGAVQWSTCNTGGFDTRLAVYNPGSACPPMDEDLYSCNDDGAGCAGFTSDLLFEVVAGETYLLRLGGFGTGDSGQGTFDLLETVPPVPPANDACVDYIETSVISPEVAASFAELELGTTQDATFVADDFIFPPCLANQDGGEFGDVWYRFNTMGLETVDIELYNLDEGETVAFYLNLMTDCTTLVDTMVIQGSCATVNNTEDFILTTVTGLPSEPIDLYVRILTRLTSDAPGEYGFQIVGDVMSNIEDEIFGANVSIAPNPTQSEAILRLNLQETAPLSVEIMNTVGQVVFKQDYIRLASGQHTIPLDVADLAAGIYFVNLRSDNSMKTMKLVKE